LKRLHLKLPRHHQTENQEEEEEEEEEEDKIYLMDEQVSNGY
jgi:hypothetical protein